MAYENIGGIGGNAPILMPGQVPGVAQQAGGGGAPTGGVAIPVQPQPAQNAPIPVQQTPMSVSPNNSGGPITQQSSTITQYIVQARNQGVNDDTILNGLRTSGLVPMENPPTSTDGEGAQLHDTGGFLGNLANSTKNFVGGIGDAIMHPIDTVTGLGKVGLGIADEFGVTQLIPGLDANTVKQARDAGILKDADEKAYNFLGFLGTRYGSWDAIKKTAYQDPVGFLADMSVVLDGAGAGLSAVGKLGEAGAVTDAARLTGEIGKASAGAKAAEVASAAGSAFSKAGDVLNPMNIAGGAITKTLGLAKAGLENIGPYLEKTALKLSPAQKAAWGEKLNPVVDYISKYIPVGGPEKRLEAAGARIDQFENAISDFINNDAANITKNKQQLLDEAEAIKTTFRGERDALEMDNQIDGFKKLLQTRYPDEIPLADVQDLKRSTFKNAFNQAGTKVSDAVEYQLGDLLKNTIEQKTEGLGVMGKYPIAAVNEKYGIALNAQKLLKIASGRPQTGFVERLLIDSIGLTHGGIPGAVIGNFLTNHAPVTAAKATIGKAARLASKTIPKIKIPAKVGNVANVLVRTKKATKDDNTDSPVYP